MNFKSVIPYLIRDLYKYLWIPTFAGMTLLMLLSPFPVFAQCNQFIIPNYTCGQDSYDTCTPGCNGTSAVYHCHASQDPTNCIGDLLCGAEDGRCSNGGGGQTITIATPAQGYKDLGLFIGNILTVLYAIAVLIVLFMLVWGAYQWITSGGDKEAVGQARARIFAALIGLAVLAVIFALAQIVGNFLGFPNITNIIIPKPE